MTELELRHRLLMLRDHLESTEAQEVTAEYDGVILTYSPDDGFNAVPSDGDPIDLTDFADSIGLLLVEEPPTVDPHATQLLVPAGFGATS